jgi:hypothetical protein
MKKRRDIYYLFIDRKVDEEKVDFDLSKGIYQKIIHQKIKQCNQ